MRNKFMNIKTIPIILASDDNYSIPLGITIFSILSNKGHDYSIDFFILDNKINEVEKTKITELVIASMCTVVFLPVDVFLNDNFLPEIGYLKKISYARLFIPKLVDRKKVIYLDTDIIVDGELVSLFDKNIEACFAAVSEPEIEKILRRKNDPLLKRYFNAGILLIDTEKWKSNHITEKALEFISKFPEKIEYADQDALNYTCQNLWEELDRKYNYEIVYNEPNTSTNPIITHYIGNIKPWHYEYPNKIDKYVKYAQNSPWKDNWRTGPTLKRVKLKLWLKFKILLKTIPGLKNVIVKLKKRLRYGNK